MRSRLVTLVGGRALIGRDLTLLAEAVLVVEDHRIAAVGRGAEVRVPEGAEVVDVAGFTLIPGFIDSHVHIGFYEPREVLAGGVTTVRDLGWPPDEIFELVRRSETDLDMPRVLAAGAMLTAPGGYPTRAAWAPPGTGLEIASPDEARAAVDDLAQRGSAVIKIALYPEVGPTLDLETVSAIVAAAHDRGLKVTGHISGLAELDKAIAAGVDELAHMLMSAERIPDDTLADMVAAGMVVVPTLSIRTGSDRRL
ncbi:MAG: amidohydrolase family protein, partial [Actinomycetota bacterium]